MRIASVHLSNFASYKALDFTFSDSGITLIQGPTGAGKSTLCDAIPWILFGRTAKNGGVDEIKSWGSKCPTTGCVELEIRGVSMTIWRQRGPNDLWFRSQTSADPVRGKDLNDTQEQINNMLGFDIDVYLAGAYFHEFSQTAQFFTTSAKNRRALTEQIVDLSFAKKQQTATVALAKALKEEVAKHYNSEQNLSILIRQLKDDAAAFSSKQKTFSRDNLQYIKDLETRLKMLPIVSPIDPKYLADLHAAVKEAEESRCEVCGGPKRAGNLKLLNEALRDALSTSYAAQKDKDLRGRLTQEIRTLKTATSPYKELIDKNKTELSSKSGRLSRVVAAKEEAQLRLSDAQVLSDILEQLRSVMIGSTVSQLQNLVNSRLDKYFDAELRVVFHSNSADRLEVEVHKDGNLSVYTQLSKGQRRILNLCFGAAVMDVVSNRHGVDFYQKFFDEALDGLDDTMKLKAFNMLNSLDSGATYVVEHSEAIKIHFERQHSVQLVNGWSAIV